MGDIQAVTATGLIDQFAMRLRKWYLPVEQVAIQAERCVGKESGASESNYLSLDTNPILGQKLCVCVNDCIQFARETEHTYEKLAHVKEAKSPIEAGDRWASNQTFTTRPLFML